MEQLITSFGINPKIFLAEIVNFLVVLGVLYFVFKKITQVLDERSAIIQSGIDNAEQAEQTLASAAEEKKAILHQAGEEATAEIKAAIETAKQREAEIVTEANHQADEIVGRAQDKGELLKEKIIDSSQEDIAKMIVLGAEQVLKTK